MAKTFDQVLSLSGEENADRQFVTALARGLEVLRTFGPEDGPLGNAEIAERTGLPKPTVSRLTHTLTILGYLEYYPRLAKYALGPSVLALGHACRSAIAIRHVARPHMQSLADDADAVVALGARDRLSMIYLEHCRSSATVAFRLDVGARVPLHKSAMGMAYLHALPARERDVLLSAIRAREPDEWTETQERLAQAFEDIDRHGFCITLGVFVRSMHAVATPLVAGDSGAFALSCTGPSFAFPKEKLYAETGPRLLAVADAIKADAGVGATPA
ncbi:MAG: IclR family transcriptional regulator [Hyphomonadaceae bacterium]|nr:IclR family transcriptional regulator [Hyphomonadaceae bacterium]GIK50934.1 MAG: transcriptional regulator [Alphaproteobacteria bacterium]